MTQALRALLFALALVGCAEIDSLGALRALNAPVVEAQPPALITWRASVERHGYLHTGPTTRAAMVLLPGLAPEGARDARLVPLARAFADRGFAVLVPDIPSFRAQRVAAGDTTIVAGAIRAMIERRPDLPIAVAAVSYGVGPAILAVLEPDLAPRVDMIIGIGGYYDARAVAAFFTTGEFRDGPGAPAMHAPPNAFGKWVFVLANADRLESPRDRDVLRQIALRRLAALDAPIEDLRRRLGAEGRAVMAMVDNTDPARAPALIEALPRRVRTELDALDLARRDLGAIRARVVLIHGRPDPIIPYTESLALARALPPGRADVALLDGLMHADISRPSLGDLMRMWRATATIMAIRR